MSVDLNSLYDVRDARGLTEHEACFLFVLVSRGSHGMYSSRKTIAEDMKCGTTTVDNAARSLVDKRIVRVTVRSGNPNRYKLNVTALCKLVPAEVHATREGHATREPPHARREPRVTPHVTHPHATRDQRKNRKKNDEGSTNPKAVTKLRRKPTHDIAGTFLARAMSGSN